MTLTATNLSRRDEISLGEARRRLEGALRLAGDEAKEDVPPALRSYWALAVSRVRRLPAEDPGPEYNEADRAAAVDEFVASPEASELDKSSALFWTRILTSYTARIPGEPPTMIGPRMLPIILNGGVPAYFTLTPSQRASMEPAVTAWLTWSASQRGLGESALDGLIKKLREELAAFDDTYDDPEMAWSRRYFADAASPGLGVLGLTEIRLRRLFAVLDEPHRGPDFDPADAAIWRSDAEGEFGRCHPSVNMTSDQLVDAIVRVVGEIWTLNPPQTWDRAKSLIDAGLSRHDVLHTLAERPV